MSRHVSFLAQYGTPEHHDKMMAGANGRRELSRHGDHQALTKLVKYIETSKPTSDDDKWDNIGVANNIITRGNKEHIAAIAKTNIPKESDDAAELLAKHGTNEHRDTLINHDYHKVRAAVATYGNREHREKLMNDPHWQVRSAVALSPKSTLSQLTRLSNDDHSSVNYNASQNIVKKVNKLKDDELEFLTTHKPYFKPAITKSAMGEIHRRSKTKSFMDSIKDDPLLKDK